MSKYERAKRERARAEVAKYMDDQKAIAERMGADNLSDEDVMADALEAIEETRRDKRKQK